MDESKTSVNARQWAETYRLWNEQKLAHHRALAGRRSAEQKLITLFDLCQAMQVISSLKNPALFNAQWQAHLGERRRIVRFEELRRHGKPPA
jgi:hypothetical protein